jgi:hypothetical protein
MTAAKTAATQGIGPGQSAGATRAAIQARIDALAADGGGVLQLPAGTFDLDNALHLRTGVTLRGEGEATVLRPVAAGPATMLARDVGYGMVELWLENPEGFDVGMGIVVGDDGAFGYYETAATIVWRRGQRIGLSTPCVHDYRLVKRAWVKATSSVVSFVDVRDAALEQVLITGPAQDPTPINGCRGGGVYMLRADDVTVRDVTVRGFPGEGVSYQACRRTILERVTTEDNAGNGLHPGSGALSFRMSDVVSRRNRGCGVFYCMNVHYGVLEDALIEDNYAQGISIGDMDSDQLIRRCTIRRNADSGMAWREDDPVGAAHRVAVVDCHLQANARTRGPRAELFVPKRVDGIYLGGCTVEPGDGVVALISHDPDTRIDAAETTGLDGHAAVDLGPRRPDREHPTWLKQAPAETDLHLPHPDAKAAAPEAHRA